MAESLPRAVLLRLRSDDMGTFGVIKGPGGFQCYSLELPWRNNTPNFSCIPKGRYLMIWCMSNRFQIETYLLSDTSPRTGIRMHVANVAGDRTKGFRNELAGCIAPGMTLGVLGYQRAILGSGLALVRYQNCFNRQTHELIIDGVVG